ncbi:MAG: endonuclease III [bacterium]
MPTGSSKSSNRSPRPARPTKGRTAKGRTAKCKAARSKPNRSRAGAPAALQTRLQAILQGLDQLYPAVTCALVHQDAFGLLVATILSAQCTDERVNLVTPKLFARYPDPASLAAANLEDVEELIRSTGFFRNKARSLVGAAQAITNQFGGAVPRTLEELVTLPGVARKTANVVLGTAFGIASGVVVDTHVKRLAGRLGLTSQTTPEKIERDLMALLPEAEWIEFSHRLIWHGRRVCSARTRHCDRCPLAPHCPSTTV